MLSELGTMGRTAVETAPWRHEPGRWSSLPLDTLLVVAAVLSLFTPFKLTLGVGQLRPFDALAMLALAATIAREGAVPRGGVPVGFVVLLPFFVWHVLSAFTLSTINGLREGAQTFLVAALAWAVCLQAHRLRVRGIGIAVMIGMVTITAYSVGWHVAEGFWTGWKRLLDPKATFTFMPLALGLLLSFSYAGPKVYGALAWASLGAVVLASGERKALIVNMILTAALASRGRVVSMAAMLAASLVVVSAAASLVTDPYLLAQLRTVPSAGRDVDVSAVLVSDGTFRDETVSNLQRSYTSGLAWGLFRESPLFGIGTNGFLESVAADLTTVPEVLRANIHGEFIRVLAENGLVGLAAYILVWATCVVRMQGVLQRASVKGFLTKAQVRVCPWIALVPCLMYVSYEATGTHSFIVLAFVSLLPEVIGVAIDTSTRKSLANLTAILPTTPWRPVAS